MSRTPLVRGHFARAPLGLEQSLLPPSPNQNQSQLAKNHLFLSSHGGNPIKYSGQHCGTTRVQTNPVYDSRKEQMKTQNMEDWKILTLKQIKRSKIQAQQVPRESSTSKSKGKIFLSISKSNRANSRESNSGLLNPSTPKQSGSYQYLSALSRKRQIVEKVQKQIEVDKKSVSIFCE